MSPFNQRIQPLRNLMKAKNLDAFVLRRNPNLSWATAGRSHVPTTIDLACFDLIITQDSAVAVTSVVEATRLIAEEFPPEVTVQTVKWSEGRDPLLPTGPKVGSDIPGGDRIDLVASTTLVSAAGGRLPGSNRVNPEALNYDDQITITDQVFAQLGF
jgi:Xaa-Pro aminopeptidase